MRMSQIAAESLRKLGDRPFRLLRRARLGGGELSALTRLRARAAALGDGRLASKPAGA